MDNYINNEKKQSYIINRIQEYREKYDIPFDQEFNLEYMLAIEYDLKHVFDDHTRTKIDLTKIYHDFQSRLRIEEKKVIPNENKKIILIVANSIGSVREMFELARDIIGSSDNIIDIYESRNSYTITAREFEVRIVLNTEGNRGVRFDRKIVLSDIN